MLKLLIRSTVTEFDNIKGSYTPNGFVELVMVILIEWCAVTVLK